MPHLMDHNATGIVIFIRSIFITASLSTVNKNAIGYQIINFSELPHTITMDTYLADFKILTPEQIKHIQPVDPALLSFMLQHEETTEVYINELLKVPQQNSEQETYWFPTPEEPGDPATYTPIQQRIYKELLELQELEELNPNDNETSRNTFLSNFDWSDTTLSPSERQEIEEILVEFHDIFARHRFDIGINCEFKVKLTPNDDRSAYSQSLPTPINLKDDITVELALLHKYGIITTLPFSKYASPIFAQRKPNGRLRLLVDLRKINNLITEDYTKNNHPVSTLSDAAQHMAGKNFSCKLDCSQAYHCLQMADYQSIQMLAFNFASRTFAYRRLAQGLSRLLSAFSSFMREYLDRAIKADQCAQYVDDIGIAANDTKQLCINIKTVFECIRNAGLKLSMSFWSETSRLSGTYNNTERSRPSSRQSDRFSLETPLSQVKKGVTKVHWIFKLLPKLHSTPFRTAFSVLQASQRNLRIQRTKKLGRSLYQPQQTLGKFLPVSFKTTSQKQTTYSHV